MEKASLIAPAGSGESMEAALEAGADAIYFGASHLNMRAGSADGFSLSDLPAIKERCARQGAQAYLTLNSVIYDHDLQLLNEAVRCAVAAGIDAVIVSDPAAMLCARDMQMPVHISTQANVCNSASIRFYAAYADAVVLSREISLRQAREIAYTIQKENITGPSGKMLKLEAFAHGALCMAVSGKCYLSLHTYNASANRGACRQNCRKAYTVRDKEDGTELTIENEYIMSSKDLCTIGFIDQLIHAGAGMLKIEGRGRSADYVYTVTQCYREAIDAVYAGTYGKKEAIERWEERLNGVFNRGFWEGYYLGKTMGEWADTPGSKATRIKTYIGKGLNYFKEKGVAEFRLEAGRLSKGNEILITGPTTGVYYQQVTELRVNGKRVDTVTKGDVFSMPLRRFIRPSDKLYRINAPDRSIP